MIQVNHIRQFIFCPRIFYFYNFCDIKPIYPLYVNDGVKFHDKQNELFKTRKFKKFHIDFKEIYKDYYLEDGKLYGICDLLLVCDDEIIVGEFKDQANLKLSKGAKMQLIAYSRLAKKKLNKDFHRVILISGNNLKFKFYNIMQKDLDDFDKIILEIEELLDSELFPNSSVSKEACMQCEFLNFCSDRE